MTVNEAMEIVDEIEDLCGDADAAPEKFKEDIIDKSRSIAETIDNTGRVTERQADALTNMRDGIAKWCHDD